MLFGWYFDSTLLIIIPGIIFSIWAQIKVNSSFSNYSKISSLKGITGAMAAQAILRANGITDVDVVHISGNLNDHYSPKEKVIRLSDNVYGATSIAAIGVAAHEAGHAVQYAKGYSLIRIRMAIVPVVNIGSNLSMPILLVGILLANEYVMMIGIALFALAVIFQLVTLPVELDASKRAIRAIESEDLLCADEIDGAKAVLSSAAMTYVAALVSSLLSLLRLLAIANRNRR